MTADFDTKNPYDQNKPDGFDRTFGQQATDMYLIMLNGENTGYKSRAYPTAQPGVWLIDKLNAINTDAHIAATREIPVTIQLDYDLLASKIAALINVPSTTEIVDEHARRLAT